jgi:hypothetical protein
MIIYIKQKFYVILLIMALSGYSRVITGQATFGNNNCNYIEDQQRPLSHYNIYRGNSHSHTIFTWTHGAHRETPITDLGSPTEFHPDWNIPSGVDWRDHKTISFNPEDYTNRQGIPDNHFKLAIENGYDFYAITDHTQEPTLQPVSRDNPFWQATIKAAKKFNDYPDFVALSGFEYSRNTTADGGAGHINVINSSHYVNADHGQRGPALPWPEANWSIPQFYNWLKTIQTPPEFPGVVVVGFNHPAPDQYNDWDHIDDEIADLISTFEIHTNYNQIRWQAYIRALNKGWKVSPIGVHDNHGIDVIINPDGPPPTFVVATELTKQSITCALRQRRTFASWIEGVELKYSVNDFIMGSTLESSDIFSFHIEIKTRPFQHKERVRRIQILRDHSRGEDDVEVLAEALFDGEKDEIVWKPVIRDSTAGYFLLRIHHTKDLSDDGNFSPHGSTISAPVWTGR